MPPQGNPEAEANRAGHGVIRVRGDHAYEGSFEICGSWVTLVGRSRKPQAGGEVYFGPEQRWTWPERRVLSITEQVAA